ncbi:UNVERIFIED_CONTAM: hypothetical protein Slati_4422200 [Sesamum latifolium]|uniref:DUF4283 domain-containing protein n=1 Tax=Sesamum latifolium TaxID=2727402 RepID=A0AAW2SQZ3_9LAMI
MAKAPTLAASAPSSSLAAGPSKEQKQKTSYAKTVQQPSAAHFQHDPGEPGIIYSSEETAFLAARLKFTLVDKFSHGLSNLNFLCIRIVKLGLKGNVTVGRLNFKHVLIRLSNEEDFSRIWLRGEWTFDSFHMRVFKWTPNFDPQIESSSTSVWIRLPELRVHLFEENALFTFAAKIGKPLRMDEPTADLSRPDLARVCVELDLTAPKVQAIYLHIEGKTYRQQVIYENCPPYCFSCNHLGHDISTCIAKPNNEKNQTEMEPKTIGNSTNHNEDPKDLRKIINNKRKGKNVVSDNAPVTITVENNAANGVTVDLPLNVTDSGTNANANADLSLPSHVPEAEPYVIQNIICPGHVEVASPDDFNYEDLLIAELLDKDWDAENTSRNVPHYINIEAVESRNNMSEQDPYISVVPNSLSEETSPPAAGIIRRLPRGESSRQRSKRAQSQEHPSPAAQMVSLDSEGAEEPTPISNRFQSLEDMETEDILQHIENTQNPTPPIEGMEKD